MAESSTPSSPTADSRPGVIDSVHGAVVNDGPSERDELGFTPYVRAVAQFLLNSETRPPLTLSIEGPWGSGKSSFMRLLKRALEDPNSVDLKLKKTDLLTVEFNAWRHDKDESLWAAFALAFGEQLDRQLSWHRRTLAQWRLFRARFDWSNGAWALVLKAAKMVLWSVVLSVALTFLYVHWTEIVHGLNQLWATVIGIDKLPPPPKSDTEGFGILSIFGSVGIIFAKALFPVVRWAIGNANPFAHSLRVYLDSPKYEDRIAFIERFHADFQKIVAAYAGDARVFVFVEDLDRCELPRAAELIQALNLMIGEDKHLVFILAMDRDKVAAGITAKYEKLLPFLQPSSASHDATKMNHNEFGHSFIEKFVQLSFILPQPSRTALRRFIRSMRPSAQVSGNSTVQLGTGPSGRSGEEDEAANEAREDERRAESVAVAYKALGVDRDSQTVIDIIQVVAPTFGNNPRRLKQFLNTFRLRALIAAETGILSDLPNEDQVTLEQLAKIVAIMHFWPSFLVDCITHELLIFSMEDGHKQSAVPDAVFEKWNGISSIRELIRSPGKSHPGATWSIASVNIRRLMEVAPLVDRAKIDDAIKSRTSGPIIGKALDIPRLEELAIQYKNIRNREPSGRERTGKLEDVVGEAVAIAAKSAERMEIGILRTVFQSGDDGDRILALGILRSLEDADGVDLVMTGIQKRRSRFEQYHALLAARAMVRDLLPSSATRLARAIREELETSIESDSDRDGLAREILGSLESISPPRVA